MRPIQPPKSKALLLIGLIAFGAVSIAAHFTCLGPGHNHSLCNAFQAFAPLIASALCFRVFFSASQHPDPTRLGWLFIGIAALSWGLGQCAWTWCLEMNTSQTRSPSLADAGFLGMYPILMVALVLLFKSAPSAGRLRHVMDGAVAASSVGILSWHFIIQPLWTESTLPFLAKILSCAYPFGDLILLVTALILLGALHTETQYKRSFQYVAVGLLFVSCGDILFSLHSLTSTYQPGLLLDQTWPLGFLSIAIGALDVRWMNGLPLTKANPKERASVIQVAAPYAAAITAFAIVLFFDQQRNGQISRSTFFVGTGLLLLVVLRQVLTLTENLSLTTQLQSLNENLEGIIERRTHQITALHHLTKAVNTSLYVNDVVETAATNIKSALDAGGVIIWLSQQEQCQVGTIAPIVWHEGFDEQPAMLRFVHEQPVRNTLEKISVSRVEADGGETAGTLLRAPLCWQDQLLGMAGVVRWDGGFVQSDRDMLEGMSYEIGAAIQNARLYDAAVKAADLDSVTGLLNHRALHQRLDKAVESAGHLSIPLSIVMTDIDNFRNFNDTYGHPVGDQILKQVAKALREECPSNVILGRYGGDEFLAAFPGVAPDKAVELAHNIRERLLTEGFRRPSEDRIVPVTLSFGVAAYPSDGANRHELLTIADTHLYTAKLSDQGVIQTMEMQRSANELRGESSSFAVLDAMVTAIDNKDRYTRRHSEEAVDYSLWIAEELGMSEETMRIIRMGGLLHDVGKIGVPTEMLQKPGRLTPEELEVMQRHPRLGALIVNAVPGMDAIVDCVRSHHERWDGQGYPDGLRGENIPLLGRLMAVADAVSALTSNRPYRKGLEWNLAMDELRAHIGTQFDPMFAEAFLRAQAHHVKPPAANCVIDEQDELPLAA